MKKSAFSLVELGIAVLIIGVVTLVALNGKSLLKKADCVKRNLSSDKITNLTADNVGSNLKDVGISAYENCANSDGSTTSSSLGTCSGTTCTSCKTLLAANPGTASGTYTIDPDGAGAIAGFDVYCDMTNDSGGWTKILHYKDTPYTPTSAAVDPTKISTQNTANISSFAKLSDAQINAIANLSVNEIYRISGDKSPTGMKYFNKVNTTWSDLAKGYGLFGASGRTVCEDIDIASCTTWSNPNGTYFDSWSDGITRNDFCNRYFTDLYSTPQCYGIDNTKRCFNSTSCPSGHPIINNLEIYLRE